MAEGLRQRALIFIGYKYVYFTSFVIFVANSNTAKDRFKSLLSVNFVFCWQITSVNYKHLFLEISKMICKYNNKFLLTIFTKICPATGLYILCLLHCLFLLFYDSRYCHFLICIFFGSVVNI